MQLGICPRNTAAWRADPTIGPGPIDSLTGQRYYITHAGEEILGDLDIPPPNVILPAPRKEPPTETKSSPQKKPAVKQESKVKRENSVKSEAKVKHEAQDDTAFGVVKGTTSKKEPKLRNQSLPPAAPSLGFINGIYHLDCPDVDSWPHGDLTLTLTPSGTAVWGAYNLGIFSGILYLPNRPWQPSSAPLGFFWRGRENSEGQMNFGERCNGMIVFHGDGIVSGNFKIDEVSGECGFQGLRDPEAGTMVRSIASMKYEWDGYNEEAYERERVGRRG